VATRRIREFLDGSAVKYVTISHSPAYTAQETAESAHIPGRKMSKTVVLRIDGFLALAVVPATRDVDLQALRRQIDAQAIALAHKEEFENRFDGCKMGAVPPFGNLFGIDTFVDPSLMGQQDIAFPAGTHTDVIVMSVSDYERLVRPKYVRMAVEPITLAPPALSI